MHIGLTLVALALGYKVLVDASKEKEGLKILGQAIGIFVILASIAGFACGVSRCIGKSGGKYGMNKDSCSMMGKADCPMAGEASSK